MRDQFTGLRNKLFYIITIINLELDVRRRMSESET